MGFIDAHHKDLGIEPICRELAVAPSSWHEHAARLADASKRSARAQRDDLLRAQIERAIVWGFDVSHLSSHLGTLELRPDFFDVFLELGGYRERIVHQGEEHDFSFPARTNLYVKAGQKVEPGTQLNEGSLYPAEILAIRGRTATEQYIVAEVQRVYRAQGVDINDKHIELIVRQMLKKIRVESKGSSDLLPGQLEDRLTFDAINEKFKGKKTKTPAKAEPVILGITKASLATESFLSAASFQETTKVLTDAALEGKRDRLMGLKENVIIGKLIPAATGLKHYRSLQIEPVEPAQPPAEELLSEEELAAELDLAGGDGEGSQLEGFGPSFAEELEELATEIETSGSGSGSGGGSGSGDSEKSSS